MSAKADDKEDAIAVAHLTFSKILDEANTTPEDKNEIPNKSCRIRLKQLNQVMDSQMEIEYVFLINN